MRLLNLKIGIILCLTILGSALCADRHVALAVLDFEERSVEKGTAKNLEALLEVHLATKESLILVERKQLKNVLDELALNSTGLSKSTTALQLGHLTGAEILIFGSIFKVGKKLYIAAKIVSAETSRVDSVVTTGEALDAMVVELADKIALKIKQSAAKLLRREKTAKDYHAVLKKAIASKVLPAVSLRFKEQIFNEKSDLSTAEGIFIEYLKTLNTKVQLEQGADDYLIEGNVVTELSGVKEKLQTVTARIEIRVKNKNGDLVASDKQTALAVSVSKLDAAKQAIEEASLKLGSRLLPKLGK